MTRRCSPAIAYAAATAKGLSVSCTVGNAVYDNGVPCHDITVSMALPAAYTGAGVEKLFTAGAISVGRQLKDLKWLREQLRIECVGVVLYWTQWWCDCFLCC